MRQSPVYNAPSVTSSPPAAETREFPARLGSLPRTADFAQGFCDGHGIARADALRLTLVIEELFTNTIRHGHGHESDAPVRVTLRRRDSAVALLYEDSAPRFDPVRWLLEAPVNLSGTAETRPVGGLGVHLLGQIVEVARYAYEDGRNRLWLTLACKG